MEQLLGGTGRDCLTPSGPGTDGLPRCERWPRVGDVATAYSVDDDFQNRAKYVVHLPNAFEIVFPEWDCTDIFFPLVLETFTVVIDQWSKRKLQKYSQEQDARIQPES